ncbi:uncharacterized protein LOC107884990 isoform X1 [Acyrthosiphon pisum]|uniref:Uncharacterized protein n=1 Tax=Acyrthosiphon pisum TaxID=7029 RepID=A0A8R2NNC7_ACYPI|nr:uncharacterized protein LOC107884990 isoform X1 [Acyrthosiphon pisum]XP_029341824.1 uncharacterized protein LOC107884990 isoform X1 [Acyrthosiphon pisum]
MEKTCKFCRYVIIATLVCCAVDGLSCQYFSQEECDSSTHRNCTTNNIDCKLGKEPAYCYATWHNNTLLNQVVITGKSCTNRQDYSQPRYVNTTRPLRDKMYCCCNSSLCNNNVEWVPEINSEPGYNTIIVLLGYTVVFLIYVVAYKVYQCVRTNGTNLEILPVRYNCNPCMQFS